MGNRVTWNPSPDVNIASYQVSRGPSGAGPWTVVTTILHNLNNPAVFDSSLGQFYYFDGPGVLTDWYRLIATDSFAQNSDPAYFQANYVAPPAAPTPANAPIIRKKIGSEVDKSTSAQCSYARYEPLITPDQLKRRFLFGIPLISAIVDPQTKKRAELTDIDLKDAIARASAQVEMEASIHVTPKRITARLPFDRAEYKSLGFFRLKDAPILQIESLQVKTADSTSVYTVPMNWVDPGQFQKGQVNIVPLQPAFIGAGGILPSFDAGGAAWLSILGQAGWVADYWEMVYVTGMDEGHVPLFVNSLIGVCAAIDIIQKIAATNRVQSYSTNLDAAGQSVSTGGAAIYDPVLTKLMEEKKTFLGRVKAIFGRRFICDNV